MTFGITSPRNCWAEASWRRSAANKAIVFQKEANIVNEGSGHETLVNKRVRKASDEFDNNGNGRKMAYLIYSTPSAFAY